MPNIKSLLELKMYDLSFIETQELNEIEMRCLNFLTKYSCLDVKRAVKATELKLTASFKNSELKLDFKYLDETDDDFWLSRVAILHALACEHVRYTNERIFSDEWSGEGGSVEDLYKKAFYEELYIIKYAVDEALNLID